ncbi:hypothetical protein D3C80_526940 [compost metagenome]
MASLTTYSPKDVTCTIAGICSVEGYADGEFIRISKNENAVSTRRAMDGTQSRVYSPDTGWQLQLTLMQSSTTNDLISALWNVDQVTRMGKFPIFIKDGLGTTMFMAASCWVESPADVVFSNQLETRTWIFACTEVSVNIGGAGNLGIESALGLGSAALPLLKTFGVI